MNLYKNLDTYLPVNFFTPDNGLNATPQVVSATQAKLGGWMINNENAAPIYVQLFFKQPAAITPGTTRPNIAPIKVGTNGAVVFLDMIPIDCIDANGAGLSAIATTTPFGNTAPATAVTATFFIARS